MRTVRVAAVQVESRNGEADANLGRAEPLVATAAARGARLVVCPELLAAGYVFDESIWRSGEPRRGRTESWLVRLAVAHRIHLGASYLEADGEDFFNTFALAAPDGRIAGRVRKESLPAFEGWWFKSSPEPKVIETELGRIAVGICNDNHTARFFGRLIGEDPDLLLMPHSAPCFPMGRGFMREALCEIPRHYTRAFGIPVVMVNKARARSRTPIPGVPLVRVGLEFPGLSSIHDSDGREVDRLEGEQGVVVGDVALDPARKRRPAEPTGSSYWSRQPSRCGSLYGAILAALEERGKRAYARSGARPLAAREAARRRSEID